MAGKLDQFTPQERKALLQFREEIQKICSSTKWELRIFGSRARMEGNEESDVDVLVVLSKYEEALKIKIWDAAYYIFADTDILISPLVLSGEQYERLKKRERRIANEIERDGIPL